MRRQLLAVISLLALLVAMPLAAQAPPKEDQALLALAREVQSQQAQIAANQIKIEEKLAAVAEAIRVARIYTSRER